MFERKVGTYKKMNQLAPNPKLKPQYSKKIHLKSGDTIEVADPTATRAMVSLMDMQAVMGGAASHFGGPSAFAEIMSALYGIVFYQAEKNKQQWHEMFHLLNDAGHCENGLYALKANYGFADLTLENLKGFRSIQSPLTGHGEAHLFPQGVYLSNGPLASCLPQSQGLCFADKVNAHPRITITAISDGACMEGEAHEAFAAIPGLAAAGKMNPFVLIISDNNTKLTGRIDKDAYSMKGVFSSFTDLGWEVIELEKGHDLQACANAIEEAISLAKANSLKPVAIHVKTIKGFGTVQTEKSSSGGHGFPLSNTKDLMSFIEEIYKGEKLPVAFVDWAKELIAAEEKKSAEKKKVSGSTAASASNTASQAIVTSEKVQAGVARALIAMKKAGHPIFSISSDLAGSTGIAAFQKEFPQSSQDIGVAESNMISMAAGMSKQGFIPVVDTFAQFGVTKGALPLTMAALSEAPVICIFSHAGFQDAADGASHQALTYFSMTCSLPHTDVYSLTSSEEAESLVSQAVEEFSSLRSAGRQPRSKIFFLGRENFPKSYFSKSYDYKLGTAQVVFDNVDKFSEAVTVVASGALLHQAIDAAYKLEKENLGLCVVNPSNINTPDINTLRTCLRNTGGRLLTVEDHQLIGGMGAIITHALLQEGLTFQSQSLGVRGEFGQSAYNAIELYKKHGLDSEAIQSAVRKMLKK